MIFWIGFLLGLIPCGLLGLILSLTGWIYSRRKKLHTANILAGVLGTIAGIIWLMGGMLGIMLIYVVIG